MKTNETLFAIFLWVLVLALSGCGDEAKGPEFAGDEAKERAPLTSWEEIQSLEGPPPLKTIFKEAYTRLYRCEKLEEALWGSFTDDSVIFPFEKSLEDLREADYVLSWDQSDEGCSAHFTTSIIMSIGRDCDRVYMMGHEILHTLGALHNTPEQKEVYDDILDTCLNN